MTDGGDAGMATDGADDTGDGGMVPYFCIYGENEQGWVGTKHQCNMEYDLDIVLTIDPPVGDPFEHTLAVIGVQTFDDSTYERPFVMACCTDITQSSGWPYADTCESIHQRACMSDFIEHICAAPGAWLSRAALDHTLQGREAIEAAAAWFDQHRNDCYQHFWLGPDALHAIESCSSELDGLFEHTPWEPGRTWTYEILGVGVASVSNVRVEPRSWSGAKVPQPPPSPAATCSLPDGNNGVAPPFPDTEEMGVLGKPLAPALLHVDGPLLGEEVVSGIGEVGVESQVRWAIDDGGSLSISHWVMTEHAPAEVGTASWSVGVERYELALIGTQRASGMPEGWQIGAESAAFGLMATIEGVATSIHAVNASPLGFQIIAGGSEGCPSKVASCLVSGPFSIAHEDSLGQAWSLDVPSMIWSP
ncbi:MAG: hypothetical protein KDK70_26070 [Myxococcales bacterium]|nr:hypothetical protein [Myxococcales bacterium]